MKYTVGALTLFLAGASAFSPAPQHSTRYDHGKRTQETTHHIEFARSFYTAVRPSLRQIRHSPVETLRRILICVSSIYPTHPSFPPITNHLFLSFCGVFLVLFDQPWRLSSCSPPMNLITMSRRLAAMKWNEIYHLRNNQILFMLFYEMLL